MEVSGPSEFLRGALQNGAGDAAIAKRAEDALPQHVVIVDSGILSDAPRWFYLLFIPAVNAKVTGILPKIGKQDD